ncbi:MAG TPA: peptidoglycan-binding domain-containing protein [Leptospiraceae bacterium]|nr:peptidoglycan-binding domain-containing protein [Leptospiraceae bacterium]HMY66116.1 peptidoglycan-binding domain-containing protein [Leptospiraceae bacterium]HNF16170.1 peptidoglycan-binding domain-containing protein [Leptospiraceae bacterium]HNF25395.1 peptidoglycan-binding domain-containing protein [Leptospiraceae bacterium]HNI96398.1 peptidoglycan-binding domain-containing protein [Leptospiraceae bacterium]
MFLKITVSAVIILTVGCSSSVPASLRSATEIKNDSVKLSAPKNLPPKASPGQCFSKIVIPAEYKTVDDQVMVSPRRTKMERIPAETETVDVKVIDVPGRTFWKASSDDEVYYLDSEPPVYKTVKKEIIRKPAYVKTTEIPAEYKTVTRKILVSPEKTEWEEVLCGNNAQEAVIWQIQKTLKEKGYNPGNFEGKLDSATLNAVNEYQRKNGLKVNTNGLINMETARSLGVKLQ